MLGALPSLSLSSSLQGRRTCNQTDVSARANSTNVRCAVQGKFYELFEMDAHVGAEVLGLMYMRVCTIKLAQSAWLKLLMHPVADIDRK